MDSSAPAVSSCPSSSSMGEQCDRGSGVVSNELHEQQNLNDVESAPPLRRSKRQIVLPACYRKGNFVSVHSCFLASPNEDCEPSSFYEAKGNEEWVCAIDDEIEAHEKSNLEPCT